MGTTLKADEGAGWRVRLFFYEAYRYTPSFSTAVDGIEPGGNMTYIYFFGAIGIFIIVIACINFMNLSTARSAGRAKEVGLRKTLGSLRGQMIGQFLAESTLYSFAAVVLALVACYFLLPQFNLLSGKMLGMQVLATPMFVTGTFSVDPGGGIDCWKLSSILPHLF